MFGNFIKERRISQGVSLREFCRRIGLDPSNWSKVERGLLYPPRNELLLKKIAKLLRIAIGSKIWIEMKDNAQIDAGRIPEDIRSDADLAQSLPLLFRTLRDDKPTPEDLDRMIELLRKGT